MSKKCVVLLSGGLDSTTVLYWAKKEGFEPHALTVHYGQLHEREILSARKIAKALSCPHQVLDWSLPWKGSSLLDRSMKLPQDRAWAEMAEGIPSTYVPGRNTLFLSFALSWAEVLQASSVWFGANAIDHKNRSLSRGPEVMCRLSQDRF